MATIAAAAAAELFGMGSRVAWLGSAMGLGNSFGSLGRWRDRIEGKWCLRRRQGCRWL